MKTLIAIAIFTGMVAANAQQPVIRPLLQAAAMGKTDEIRKKLPDLLVEYPDDPGVQYLHAVILEDAAKAAPLFEKIVKNYPTSEWADDAEWRIVQYYAMKKDTARARTELASFRAKYPQSEFLLAATDAVKFSVGSAKIAGKQTETPKDIADAKHESLKSAVKNTPAITAAKTNATKVKPDYKSTVKNTPKTEASKNVKVAAAIPKISNDKTSSKDKAVAAKSEDKVVSIEKIAAAGGGAKTNANKPAIEKSQSSINAFAAASGKEADNEIEASTFESSSEARSSYSLQVGSYATLEQAENEAKNFHQKRLRVVVGEKKVSGAVKYAVYIGEYTSRDDAEKARAIVEKQCSCKPFVVSR